MLAYFLQERGLPGCSVHAHHVRSYAKALGTRAKTDAIDARIIAEYARMRDLEPSATVAEHPELGLAHK